ncbi:hypothetical protein C8R45DRAFT_1073986 [Mycena sanguinolenta]|nr:hypothetical protein C8R45DRAFT_1073986 [Mycena sanguinolenta]
MTDSLSVRSLSSSDFENHSVNDDDTTHTLLESASRLLMMTHEAPKRTWHINTRTLRISAFILHSALIVTHLLLLGVWALGLENRVTVALEHEKLVSYLITTTTTTFGTIYAAVVVFVTQTLATRCSLQRYQMLTITHDTTTAWAGLGSAVSLLWNQAQVPSASVKVVLSIIIYLAAISGLHISSASLFALVAFNSTRTYHGTTKGLPALNGAVEDNTIDDLGTYAMASLNSLVSILYSEANIGLHGGTLYDVLDVASSAPGNATADATGFNITCGSSNISVPLTFSAQTQAWSSTEDDAIIISSTQPGIITTVKPGSPGTLIFYSTIPIIDSAGEYGPLVSLNPAMNTSVSSIQLFQCALSPVTQVAVVDSPTKEIRTIEPDLTKTASKWTPHTGIPLSQLDGHAYPNITGGNLLIDMWQSWYQLVPSSNFELDFIKGVITASVADIYLIQKLNLPAANHSDTQNITLHDLENALSILVASIFWTFGHVIPPYIDVAVDEQTQLFPNGTINRPLNNLPISPILIPGIANITEIFAETQLELSIIAVSAGLVVSLVLMAVALPLLRGFNFDEDLPLDGTGILHAIWLFRNHPELQRLLEQVEHPTDENLRAAGMVQTKLVGDGVSNEEKRERV